MTGTLTLRKGPITVLVDMPAHLMQTQWDAIGSMVAHMEDVVRRLENADQGHSDKPA